MEICRPDQRCACGNRTPLPRVRHPVLLFDARNHFLEEGVAELVVVAPPQRFISQAGEAALRRGLDELNTLGARPAAAIVARRLRELGVRGLPRGPRESTRANAAQLTARELDVLNLLAEGHRNAEIAERLVVSRRTVDYHVSSILRKLDAHTRGEAVAEARRLGLIQDR